MPAVRNARKSSLVARCAGVRAAAAAVCLAAMSALIGCGNGWIASDDRQQTPSARFLKAQLYYDKGRFAEAAAIYRDLLADDPNNDRARVRLAYAFNGIAGLGPLDLLTKLSKIQSSSATSRTGAAGTSTTKSSTASLTSLTSAAGLSKSEREAIVKANPATYLDLLNADTKFKSLATSDKATYAHIVTAARRVQNLRASWITICQLIPKRILDTVVAGNPVRRKGLEIDECKGGYPSDYQKPAVLFAAAMEALAQGATLYQIKLDTDGDGTVDLVKKAETLTKDISALNSQSQAVSDPAAISAKLVSLNEKVAALNAIGATLKSELVDLTLAHFEIMSLLITAIEDVVPENVSKSLLAGIKKFEESKTKIAGYVSTTGGGKPSSVQNGKIQASAKAAATTADKYFDNYVTQVRADPALSPEARAAKEQSFSREFAKTCDGFDSMKATYGLPSTVERPSNCAKVASLLLGPDAGSDRETVGAPAPVAVGSGRAFRLDLPDARGPVLESTDADGDLLEFARLGDRFLRDE